jgi:tetratricopeptide (TPR) repeat protein
MLLQQNLNADDPLLRLGALQALELYPVQQRLLAFPLVWDDIKAVRILAARLMAGYPQDQIKDEQAEVLKAAIKEYIEAQEFNGERAESLVNLAGLYIDMDDFTQAEEAYRKAVKLQPQFVPAYINFAQMLKNLSREKEAANTLTAGIQQVPESASLYHALGLSQIRQKDVNSALQSLGKAATLDADNNRYQYVYAVALQSVGKVNLALEILRKTHDAHPYDTDVLYTLVTFSRDAGRQKEALSYANKLQALVPGNPDIEKLVQQLKAK